MFRLNRAHRVSDALTSVPRFSRKIFRALSSSLCYVKRHKFKTYNRGIDNEFGIENYTIEVQTKSAMFDATTVEYDSK